MISKSFRAKFRMTRLAMAVRVGDVLDGCGISSGLAMVGSAKCRRLLSRKARQPNFLIFSPLRIQQEGNPKVQLNQDEVCFGIRRSVFEVSYIKPWLTSNRCHQRSRQGYYWYYTTTLERVIRSNMLIWTRQSLVDWLAAQDHGPKDMLPRRTRVHSAAERLTSRTSRPSRSIPTSMSMLAP